MHVEDVASQSSVVFETQYKSMAEKTQFPGFMFMFPHVVQKH